MSGTNDAVRRDRLKTALVVVLILAFTAIYFLTYFNPVGLHDIAHYAVSGVSLIRDNKDLLYPYHPESADGLGPSYSLFQSGTIVFDQRWNYPAKLYSLLLGAVFLLLGDFKFEYVQYVSATALLASNLLLYLIARKYLDRVESLLLLAAVCLTPAMIASTNPGNDLFGYLGGLVVVWLLLCNKFDYLKIGLATAVVANFRGQMVSLLVLIPLLSGMRMERPAVKELLKTLGVFVVVFAALSILFAMIRSDTSELNPVGFYVDHFAATAHGGRDWPAVLRKFVSGLIGSFDSVQLFIVATLPLLVLFYRQPRPAYLLALAGIVYSALPIVLYSFDALAPVQSRYFMLSVPLILLATFMALKHAHANKVSPVRPRVAMAGITMLIAAAWFNAYGLPIENLDGKSVTSRLHYLDFPGAQAALEKTFAADDIVIVNHSLPTGLSRVHNVIYMPDYAAFLAGNNRSVAGIVMVYGEYPPNDFFLPKDWLKEGAIPPRIVDNSGHAFGLVYSGETSIHWKGLNVRKAHFLIYRNEGIKS